MLTFFGSANGVERKANEFPSKCKRNSFEIAIRKCKRCPLLWNGFSSVKSHLNGFQKQTVIERNGIDFRLFVFPSKWIGNEIFGREFYSVWR